MPVGTFELNKIFQSKKYVHFPTCCMMYEHCNNESRKNESRIVKVEATRFEISPGRMLYFIIFHEVTTA